LYRVATGQRGSPAALRGSSVRAPQTETHVWDSRNGDNNTRPAANADYRIVHQGLTISELKDATNLNDQAPKMSRLPPGNNVFLDLTDAQAWKKV